MGQLPITRPRAPSRWSDAWAARFDKLVTSGSTFDQFQAKNIKRTLARLKADLEG